MPKNISFAEFFEKLHKCKPFPWQERLAREISENQIPASLNLPTASGKTAVIDIWLWSLYADISENKPEERRIPLRLFYVVDRRLIADAAFDRAEKIKETLKKAENGVLKEVADGLKKFFNTDSPLETAILRGGMAQERNWCKSPTQPMVCCGTVDMIGSRLLFRGYGTSPGQRPIDAGLIGHDAMIVLDEAHISQAFEQTLKKIPDFSKSENGHGNLQIVSMSATGKEDEKPFELTEPDLENEVLKKRFDKEKPVRLEQAESEKTDDIVKKLADEAKKISESPKLGVIAVVANTVDVARKIFDLLKKEENSEAILLTGRCRPFDRDQIIEKYGHRLFAQKSKTDDKTPLFVVATQCIEVGVDFDFDAMVTEIAPLDSLIQRFGRLNRFGDSDSAEGVVVAPQYGKNPTERAKQIPFYGNAPEETWKKMEEEFGKNGEMDFSSSATGKLKTEKWQDDWQKLCAPHSDALALFPEYADIWSRTSIEQFGGDDISLFLHGEPETADVQVVWRGDVPEEPNNETLKPISRVLSHLPPRVDEAVSLSLWSFRNWLAKGKDETLADIEGVKAEVGNFQIRKKVIRWRGYEKDEEHRAEYVFPDEIKPGDVVVLPSKLGGCDEFGWNPQYTKKVKDIAKETRETERPEYAVRVHPDCCDCDTQWNDVKEKFGDDLPESKQIAEKLFGINNPASCRTVYYGEEWEKGFALLIRENRQAQNDNRAVVLLENHNKGVAEIAEKFAKGAGLPDELVDAIKTAAEWHDAGKAENRWQEWAKNGENISGDIAKPIGDLSPKAWGRAGLSAGERHEYWSYLLAKKFLANRPAEQKDLILHLIASHHGNARPFPIPPKDGGELAKNAQKKEVEYNGEKTEVAHSLWRLDSGFASRFAELNKKHGYWGLAYLEAIVRLADIEQSKRES